ncbi:MAG: ureidoglycolate lyase [Lautropia sp.]
MRTIRTEPISARAFEPFGELLEAPAHPGRTYFNRALGNARASAPLSLSLSRLEPTPARSLDVQMLERHEFSSQSFLPLDASRYLVIVAPHAAGPHPDPDAIRAFVVPGHQGISYAMNVWHHGMVVLDRPARFAVVMWRDGGAGDEQFVPLDRPVRVEIDD